MRSDVPVVCDYCGDPNGRLITYHFAEYSTIVAVCAKCKDKVREAKFVKETHVRTRKITAPEPEPKQELLPIRKPSLPIREVKKKD